MQISRAFVDFSAEFGGRDAAEAVLPHFKALKAAKKDIFLEGFPFPELSFVLRVDGEVSCYGFSGVGEPEVDRDGEYLAIDIGVTLQDRDNVSAVIGAAILDSIQIIDAAITSEGIRGYYVENLRSPLTSLRDRYQQELSA